MVKKITQKLRSKTGETIAETLVGLLIAAFAMTMLATAVMTASNLVTKSRENMDAYYAENEAPSGVVLKRSAGSPSTVTFNAYDAIYSPLYDDFSMDIEYYENDKLGTNIPVISYKKK